MMNMNNFIQRGGRANSPQSNLRNGPSDRERRAANAKVPVNRSRASQQLAGRRRSGENIDALAHQQQSQQRRGSGERQVVQKRDQYDTDAESLDTTTQNQSIANDEDVQLQRQEFAQEAGNNNEEDVAEEEEDDDDGEYEQPFDPRLLGQQYHQNLFQIPNDTETRKMIALCEQVGGGYLGNGNSYPSTTSGPPEGFPDNWTAGLEPFSDQFHDERALSPSPPKPAMNVQSARQITHQPNQRLPTATQRRSLVHAQSTMMDQAADIRDMQRSARTTPANVGNLSRTNEAFPPSSQPQTYSHTHDDHGYAPPANVARQQPPTEVALLPQRGARAPAGPPRTHISNTAESSIPAKLRVPAPAKNESIPHHPSNEETPLPEPEASAIEDYDRQTLFDMSYDQLKNEDFDTVPRGKAQVLSGDMLNKPLNERLEHVWQSLDAVDQAKFFRALPTRAWEESGEWFLDRFSDIIQRTKDARQKKRKLAKEFEDQVEKRYRQVAKKKKRVQDAMDKMKTQGQGLIPRSPRTSKSPRRA